jgi:uncharacterized cupredoxin-like copper-binding protein
MRFRSLSAAAALVLALTVVGAAAARSSVTDVTKVKVTAKDFSFVLSQKTVKHGRVTFTIRNAGQAPHDFAIAGRHSKTIGPGKTTTLTVTFAKRGRYPYRCTVDSHAELGMKGVLRVT